MTEKKEPYKGKIEEERAGTEPVAGKYPAGTEPIAGKGYRAGTESVAGVQGGKPVRKFTRPRPV